MNTKKWKGYLWAAAWIALMAMDAQGQAFEVIQRQWGERDGLPYGAGQAVVLDDRGLVWVMTKGGLSRFDGQDFKLYGREYGVNKYALVSRLFADGRYLWILYPELSATNERVNHIEIFDTWRERAISFEEHFGSQLPFAWKSVNHVRLGQGEVQFQLSDGKVYLYQLGRGFEALPTPNAVADQALTPGQTHLNYNVQGMNHFDVCIKRSMQDLHGVSLTLPMLNQGAFTALESRSKDLYILKSDGDNYIYTSTLYRIEGNEYIRIYEEKGSVRAQAYYLPKLDLFLWWNETHVKLLDTDGVPLHQYEIGEGLFNRSDWLHVDGDKVWQAHGGGLSVLYFRRTPFEVNYAADSYQGFRDIRRIGDALYLAHSNGVLRHDSTETPRVVVPAGLYLLPDSSQGFWTINTGKVYHYDARTNTYEWQHSGSSDINEIWSMAFRRMGHGIYLSQSGVVTYDWDRGRATPIAYNEYAELANHTVYHFEPLPNGQYWLCATSGLYLLDERRGIIARYWSGGRGKYHLPTDDFRHLYIDDATQTLWLATGGQGLVEWQPHTGTTHVHTFHGEVTNILHGVYADRYGHLWMSSEGGIIQFDRTTHQFRVYTTYDGLPHDEFNRTSHFQEADGTLYFGGNAVVSFHPRDFAEALTTQADHTPQIVAIQQYLGRTNSEEWVTHQFFEEGRIRLRPRDRYFKIRLTLDDLLLSSRAVYYYRIARYDQEWTRMGATEITLGRLPYGQQALEVKALLPSGQFTRQVLTIPIWIYRPFYLTWWFILLCVAVIGSLFYALYRYRIAQFEKRQRLRTQIATDLHDDVGSLLSRLAMQAEMIKYVPRERAEAILKDIILTSRSSIDTMRDIIWAIDARNDNNTDIFLRMEEQLEEVLTPAGLSYHLNTKAVTHDQPLAPDVRQNIFFIFKEAITNVVKHSQASAVNVTVVYNRRIFKMTISEVFETSSSDDRAHRLRPQLSSHKTGSGTRNMHTRAKRIGATLNIERDQGYTITLIMNL